MAEKLLQEVRLFETDSGFRVEVSGDDARLRELGLNPSRPVNSNHLFRPRMGLQRTATRRAHPTVKPVMAWPIDWHWWDEDEDD